MNQLLKFPICNEGEMAETIGVKHTRLLENVDYLMVRSVAIQRGQVVMWVETHEHLAVDTILTIQLRGTGRVYPDLPAMVFVGTVLDTEQSTVGHLYAYSERRIQS